MPLELSVPLFSSGVFWEHLMFELDARRCSTLLAQDRWHLKWMSI
jgi:hypothetical protein